jgi:hypothetical protein
LQGIDFIAAEEAKQEQAQQQKEAITLSKKLREKEKQLDKKRPDAVKAKEEVVLLERRVKEGEEAIKRLTKQREEQGAKLAQLEKDLKDLERYYCPFCILV